MPGVRSDVSEADSSALRPADHRLHAGFLVCLCYISTGFTSQRLLLTLVPGLQTLVFVGTDSINGKQTWTLFGSPLRDGWENKTMLSAASVTLGTLGTFGGLCLVTWIAEGEFTPSGRFPLFAGVKDALDPPCVLGFQVLGGFPCNENSKVGVRQAIGFWMFQVHLGTGSFPWVSHHSPRGGGIPTRPCLPPSTGRRRCKRKEFASSFY